MGCIVKTILCGTVLNPLLQEMLEKHFGKLILQYVIRLPAFWLHVSHIILKRHFKNLSDFSSSLDKALMIMSAWRALYLRYLCAYNYNATSSHLLNLFFPSCLLHYYYHWLPRSVPKSISFVLPVCKWSRWIEAERL